MLYFVGNLSEVEYIFLPGSSQVFSLLKIRFKSIFESYKSLIEKGDSLIYSVDR